MFYTKIIYAIYLYCIVSPKYYIGHIYTKTLLVVNSKFKFNWALGFLFGWLVWLGFY